MNKQQRAQIVIEELVRVRYGESARVVWNLDWADPQTPQVVCEIVREGLATQRYGLKLPMRDGDENGALARVWNAFIRSMATELTQIYRDVAQLKKHPADDAVGK